MLDLLRHLRIADLADVLIVAVLAYWLITVIRGTRAVQMLIGLVALALLFTGSQYFEMYTLSWILSSFLSSLILVIVVLFQNEIRRALTQVGRGRMFGERRARTEIIDEVARAAATLAARRIGAIMVLERKTPLAEFLEAGTEIAARVSRELLFTIFLPASPLHDGAVVIRHGRIAVAGAFLPLTSNPVVSKALGSRHRAALGLSEETDAAVVVVSEEEGHISLAIEGRLTRALDAGSLRAALEQLSIP